MWPHKTQHDLQSRWVGNKGEPKRENINLTASPLVGSSHLVVPDDCDVCRRVAGAAVVGDVVVFGTRDPAGGEEERVELHAQRLPSHVLHRQLAADGKQRQQDGLCWYLVSNRLIITFFTLLKQLLFHQYRSAPNLRLIIDLDFNYFQRDTCIHRVWAESVHRAQHLFVIFIYKQTNIGSKFKTFSSNVDIFDASLKPRIRKHVWCFVFIYWIKMRSNLVIL